MDYKFTMDILISCMYQKNMDIVSKSHIKSNTIIVNQCDYESYSKKIMPYGTIQMFSTKQRGLTKSRNMAIQKSKADICLLCDDDEIFQDDYVKKVLNAYNELPQADIIVFKMANRVPSFKDKVMEIKFPMTMKVCSWQISFKRQSLIDANIKFDELLGAGTNNGAEEELKFLTDCRRVGLKIYYVPSVIASVGQNNSTWFHGFNEKFFRDRGNTTRYILGLPLSIAYAVYYIIKKYDMYKQDISFKDALKSIFQGIKENRIYKLNKL